MKKQPSPAKAPVKAKAKTTKTTKAIRSNKTAKTATVTKKNIIKHKKGLVHHTKRIYHLTPKFVHGALIGAFVGMLVVTWIGSTGNVKANQVSDKCWIHVSEPVRGTAMTDPVDGLKKFHEDDGRAYIKVLLHGKGCVGNQNVVLAAWKAPAANFKPYKDQVLVNHNKKVLEIDKTVTMSIPIPQCYFQIDLVRGTDPRGKDGGGAYQEGRMIHSIKGGNKSCTPPDQPPFQKVCLVATGKIVTIRGGQYDTLKYAPINDPRCAEKPGFQHVCELKTGAIVQIPAGSYDTTQYGLINAEECNRAIVVTNTGSTLTKTGPPAVLTIIAFAVVGGYTFHHTHRHIKHRRQRKHA